jgi:uncharacterized protein
MRVVLDTNVWLDVLVFESPAMLSLSATMQRADVRIAIDEATLDELAFVAQRLADSAGALQERRQRAATTAQWCSQIVADNTADIAYTINSNMQLPIYNARKYIYPHDSIKLKRCKDSSDQKFLELASHAGASLLITHDKALLKCRNYAHVAQPNAAISTGRVLTPLQAERYFAAQLSAQLASK